MPNKIIYVDKPVYPTVEEVYRADTPWIFAGRYEVVREFDETRYLIRLSPQKITLISKSLTKSIT